MSIQILTESYGFILTYVITCSFLHLINVLNHPTEDRLEQNMSYFDSQTSDWQVETQHRQTTGGDWRRSCLSYHTANSIE